jgi:inner membrane protein involved in colicin E2 resistance
MMLLFGGTAILSLLIKVASIAATSLLIERHRLFALADTAAIVGTESFDPTLVTKGVHGSDAPLTSALVRQAVGFFLLRSDLSHLDSVVLESGTTPDGRHSQVVLSSLWRPPVVSEFFPASLRIGVQA